MAEIKQPPPVDLRSRAAAAAQTAATAGVISEETLARILNGEVSRRVIEEIRRALARSLVLAEADGRPLADGRESSRQQRDLAAAQSLFRAVVSLFAGAPAEIENEIERAADDLAQGEP